MVRFVVLKLWRYCRVGLLLENCGRAHQADPLVVEICFDAIGSESETAGPNETCIDDLRRKIAAHLSLADVGPVCGAFSYASPARAWLFGAWAKAASDPGAEAVARFTTGAPAGILSQPLLTGGFPLAGCEEGDTFGSRRHGGRCGQLQALS